MIRDGLLLDRIFRVIVGRPWFVLAGLAALTLLAIVELVDVRTGQLRLAVDPSLDRLMPDDDADRRFYDTLRQRFGSDETIIVALVDDPLFTAENMRRLKRMTDRIGALDGVVRVVSLATALDIRSVDGDLRIEPFLAEVPDDPAALEAVKRAALANPVYAGNLVSSRGDATALVVHVANMTEREFVSRGLEATITQIAEEERGTAQVWLTGTPVVKAATARTLLGDLALIIPAAFGLTLLVAFLSFRSVRGVVIPLVSVSLGVLWTLALMVAFDRPLNLVTTIIPPLLLTVGYAYSMHFVAEYYALAKEPEPHGGEAGGDLVYRALRHVAVPIFVCGVTTVVGFASLMISPLSAIQEFGAFSVVGTFLTVMSSLVLPPAILALLRTPKRVREEASGTLLDRFSERIARFDVRHRRPIFFLYGALIVLCLFGMTRIEVSTNLITDFGEDTPVRRHFEAVNEHLEGANPLYVVVESEATDAFKDPANLRELRALQDWLEQQPEIGSTTSIADYVALVNRGFNDNDPAFLTIPDSKRLVSQLLTFAANDEMAAFIDTRHQAATVLVRSRTMDSGRLARLVRGIEERLSALPQGLRGTVTGNTVLIARTIDNLAVGQAQSLLTGFVLIYGVLALLFMSLRIGLLALIPNAFPVAAYFGLMGFAGVTLNAVTGLVACIVLGIAVDDTIHYMHRFNAEAKRLGNEERGTIAAMRALGRPVTLTAVALCLGFLVLSLSHLRSQAQFGWLAAATLAIGWACEMTLTPAICSATRIVTLWDVLALDLGEEPRRQVPLFRGLRAGQARIAALMMTLCSFPKGARVMSEGEQGRDMYVVLDGEMVASVATDEGRRELAVMGRGDSVGEVALFHGVRTADVDTRNDVRAVRLSRHDLVRLRRRYPRIGAKIFWNLSEILASRVANTTKKMR
jgi:predicted RND superfamily exporter protein